MLQGKHILIGISGGIAAYKIPELIRLFKKAGAEVKVTTTSHALEFVTPLVLETLSQNKVYTDVFATGNDHTTEHISLPDWADLMVVAPATANIIGKMACGIADDALSTTFIAMQKPVVVAPAMNDKMLSHPAVERNLHTIADYPNCSVLPTAEGFLACGTSGKGRMLEPEAIFEAAKDVLTSKSLSGKRVMITAGPTQEKLDPVRFVSNYSTGKMGIALAEEAARRGAEVSIILGPTSIRPELNPIHPIHVVDVCSAMEMYDAAKAAFSKADIAILCAAVADYRPAETADKKIKREKTEEMQLALVQNPDIAATLGSMKTDKQKMIGFALETDNAIKHGTDKLARKNLDMIVVNSLQDEGAGFGTDTNKITLLTYNTDKTNILEQTFELKSKQAVAADILDQTIRL